MSGRTALGRTGSDLDLPVLLPGLGVVAYLMASGLHGGEQPADLPAVLPQYADNGRWLLSHAGQLLGMLLLLAGWAALLSRRAWQAPSVTAATQRVLWLAAAVYTVNQAVDGVAIRHVAQAYVDSPAELRPTSLLVADAVRHVEIGLTSGFQALVGVALLLTALAVRASGQWFAALPAVVGVSWLVLAADVAANGFEHPGPAGVAALGLLVWAVALTAVSRTARSERRPAG